MMRCRSSTPFYWMRTMYPCVVRPVLEEVVEPALRKSFVLLAEAGHSPQELIDQAWAEAQALGPAGRALRWLRPRRARTNGGCELCGGCPLGLPVTT